MFYGKLEVLPNPVNARRLCNERPLLTDFNLHNYCTTYLRHGHGGKRVPQQLLLLALVAAALSLEYPGSGQRGGAHPVADQEHDVFRPCRSALVAGQPFLKRGPRLLVPMVAFWKMKRSHTRHARGQ